MAKTKKEKKEKQPPEAFWNELVGVFFDFTRNRFHDVPSFDGSAPRDLKTIIQTLRKRAEDGGVEWNHEVATTRFRLFLEFAASDRWLADNWLLQNINRQKDKMFFKIAQQRAGEK